MKGKVISAAPVSIPKHPIPPLVFGATRSRFEVFLAIEITSNSTIPKDKEAMHTNHVPAKVTEPIQKRNVKGQKRK